MDFIPIEVAGSRKYNPVTKLYDDVKYTPCPYGERDLQKDECYSGNGKNKCPYFVRYDWEKHPGCIACNHPPKKQFEQLEFDFD